MTNTQSPASLRAGPEDCEHNWINVTKSSYADAPYKLCSKCGLRAPAEAAGEVPDYVQFHRENEATPTPSQVGRGDPVCIRIPLCNHMSVTLEDGSDGRLITLWNEAGEPIGDADLPDLSALHSTVEPEELGSSAAPIPTEGPLACVVAERDAFEAWYCEDAALSGLTFHPRQLARLRDGDSYGKKRVALNSKWEGWQGRAAIEAARKGGRA